MASKNGAGKKPTTSTISVDEWAIETLAPEVLSLLNEAVVSVRDNRVLPERVVDTVDGSGWWITPFNTMLSVPGAEEGETREIDTGELAGVELVRHVKRFAHWQGLDLILRYRFLVAELIDWDGGPDQLVRDPYHFQESLDAALANARGRARFDLALAEDGRVYIAYHPVQHVLVETLLEGKGFPQAVKKLRDQMKANGLHPQILTQIVLEAAVAGFRERLANMGPEDAAL